MNRKDRKKLPRYAIELETEEELHTKEKFLKQVRKNETTGKNVLLAHMRTYNK